MLRRAGRRFGKVSRVGKLFGKVLPDLFKGPELRSGHRLEHDFIAMLFDQHLGAFESESPRQADGLAASMLKDLRSRHSYKLYLLPFDVKRRAPSLGRHPSQARRNGARQPSRLAEARLAATVHDLFAMAKSPFALAASVGRCFRFCCFLQSGLARSADRRLQARPAVVPVSFFGRAAPSSIGGPGEDAPCPWRVQFEEQWPRGVRR
jgi:hypothetical protein